MSDARGNSIDILECHLDSQLCCAATPAERLGTKCQNIHKERYIAVSSSLVPSATYLNTSGAEYHSKSPVTKEKTAWKGPLSSPPGFQWPGCDQKLLGRD